MFDPTMSGYGMWETGTDNEANQYFEYYVVITLPGDFDVISNTALIGKWGDPEHAELYARKENGTFLEGFSADSIGLWSGFIWHWNYPTVGGSSTHVLSSGDMIKVRPNINGLGEKFHRGQTNSGDVRYQNYDGYPVYTTIQDQLTFHHRGLYDATIQAELLDAPLSVGEIQFKDPWLEDVLGYGGEYASQGMLAPFKSHTSPWTISTDSEYHGVFLNQSGPPFWAPPYYAVKAPEPNYFDNVESYFLNWTGTNVVFQDADDEETAVVFQQSEATATARYKAYLSTSAQSAAGPSGQRKVVSFGTLSHCVYESGNSIWYSQRVGSSWTPEVQLSSPENGAAKNPSIAVTYVAPYVHVHVVWEQTLEDIGGQPFQAVVYMRSTNGGSSWQLSWLSDTDFGTWGAYDEDATPVIAGAGSNVVVVWKYDDFYGAAGLAWKANPIDWPAAPTRQIRYTDDSRKNPSLDGQTSFKLAYVMSGRIWFDEFNLSTNCGPTWCDAVYVGGGPADLSSEYSWMSDCTNPSVTSNNGNPVFVSWDANNIPAGGTPPLSYRNVFVREKVSGVWQPVREFGTTVEDVNASVGVDPRNGYQKVNVLWQKPTAIAKVSRNLSGGSWSSVSSLGAGYSPTVTGINLNGLTPWGMWTTGSTAPYGITLSDIGGAPPAMISELKGRVLDPGSDVIVTRRASVRLDSLRISGLEPGSVTGNLVLESPRFEIIASSQRTPLEFVQDTVEFSDWMGTSTSTVLGNADSIAGNIRLILQNFRVADPRAPLGTPVLTAMVSVNGNHLTLRLVTLGDLVALGRSDTTLDYSHRVQARTLRNKTIQIEQVIIGQSAFQEPAWSEKWWSEDEELNVLALVSQSSMEESERPSSYALYQNYPNPFNPMTTVRYALPSDGHVSLKLYDVLGKEILDLVDAFELAGYHEVALDANNIASGIYFYRLSAGDYSDIKKLAVVK